MFRVDSWRYGVDAGERDAGEGVGPYYAGRERCSTGIGTGAGGRGREGCGIDASSGVVE